MRVLVAYDGSSGADQAVALTGAVQWPADSAIRIVSVVEPAPLLTAGLLFREGAEKPQAELVAYHEGRVADAVRRVPGSEGAVRHGRAATVLVDEATALDADIVVLGSRGHGEIASLLLGSVSAEVVDHAPCPVLVARQPAITKIVLTTDGSAPSAAAEDLVAHWPIADDVPVRVLSVAEIIRPWHTGLDPMTFASVMKVETDAAEVTIAEHQRLADEATSRLHAAGRDAVAVLRHGDPAREIIAEAAETGADVVVIGSRGRTGLARVFLGSVARNVLHSSEASVLVVRPQATTGEPSADGSRG